MIAEEEINNFSTFQDCVATSIVAKLTAPGKATKASSRQRRSLGRKTAIKPVIREPNEGTSADDAAELSDFIEVRTSRLHDIWASIVEQDGLELDIQRNDTHVNLLRSALVSRRGNLQRSSRCAANVVVCRHTG